MNTGDSSNGDNPEDTADISDTSVDGSGFGGTRSTRRSRTPSKKKKTAQKKMVSLAQHPSYAKYFTMLKDGVPIDVVQNKMQEEGLDSTLVTGSPDDIVEIDDSEGDDDADDVTVARSAKKKQTPAKERWCLYRNIRCMPSSSRC